MMTPLRRSRMAPERTARPRTLMMMRAYCETGTMHPGLYRALYPRLRAGLSRVLPPQEVDDALQETMLRAHKSRHLFRWERCSEGQLFAWFRSIGRNVVLDRFRRSARRRARIEHLEDAETWVLGESSINLSDGLETCSLRCEQERGTRDSVRRGIDALPAPYRHVLTQHRLRGRPLAEIAAEAGVSTVAMRVRAHRGYRALATSLQGA